MRKANQAELYWDSDTKRWVVRFEAGEEVVQRPFKYARHAVHPDMLRSVAIQMAREEGFELAKEDILVVDHAIG